MTSIAFRRSCALALLLVTLGSIPAAAGPLYLALIVDPATTAGAGIPTIPRANSTGTFSVTSNKSGPGSFHLYALDDISDSFGIAFFSVNLNGTLSNVFNRSPIANFDTLDTDSNSTGESGSAGFSDGLIRSGTGVNPVQGAQVIGSAFRIGGLGQTASNFNNTPNLPVPPADGSRAWSGIISGAWGNYATAPAFAPDGRKWLLLGEGNYTGNAPSIDIGPSTIVLYYATADFNSQKVAPFLPEPSTISLLGFALAAFCTCKRRHR